MNIPIISITVEQMKLALDRACTPELIQETIDSAAYQAVTETVSNAVKRWYATSDAGRKLIEEAITERLEEARLYGGRKKTKGARA